MNTHMEEICPCPNLSCPNHGDCEKCISRHARKGFLNYCSFYTLLPILKEVIDAAPESKTAQKLEGLISAQLQAYEKLKKQHGMSQEELDRRFKQVTRYSDH